MRRRDRRIGKGLTISQDSGLPIVDHTVKAAGSKQRDQNKDNPRTTSITISSFKSRKNLRFIFQFISPKLILGLSLSRTLEPSASKLPEYRPRTFLHHFALHALLVTVVVAVPFVTLVKVVL